MAYISTEEVKVIREDLKKEFSSKDGWKFSIVRDHYSSLSVSILEAPFDLIDDDKISEESKARKNFTIGSHGKGYKYSEIYEKIWSICNKKNFDHSDSMTDYFHLGFYFDLSVGKWDKPFKMVETKLGKNNKKSIVGSHQEIITVIQNSPKTSN